MRKVKVRNINGIPCNLETKDKDNPENKHGYLTSTEFKSLWDNFLRSHEEFKKKNDERLNELEEKGVSDVVLNEQVDKINKSLSDMQENLEKEILALKRKPMGDDKKDNRTEIEQKYAEAFDTYLRSGDNDRELKDAQNKLLEEKAMSVGDATMGGFVTPFEQSFEMDRLVSEVSPIRQIAQVMQISTGMFKKPFNLTGTTSGWVSETGSRPQTQNPEIDELEFPVHELYAMPAATQTLLDDAAINIESWMNNEVVVEFAEQEGRAFVVGTGQGMPKGFMSYPVIDETSNAWTRNDWGKLGYIPTGAANGFDTSNDPGDAFIDAIYVLKQAYRSRARWVMNRATQGEVRKFKDGDGNYLWQPAFTQGQPAMLLGFPITEAEDMPDVGADEFPVAFGDFNRCYLIVDRMGVRVLRDPFTSKPYILFYTTKRVGGGVQNFEGIKLLKCEA